MFSSSLENGFYFLFFYCAFGSFNELSLIYDYLCLCIAAKALELFLQDLCDQTYEITLRRGAKTMNAFHL